MSGPAANRGWFPCSPNLRSTRETDLTERFPVHVICEWIGNSAPVAAKHYLQVTDEHYHNRPGGIRTPDQGIMSPLL